MAAVGDLHCSRNSAPVLQPMLETVTAQADVLVLCGDLTDFGLPEEARMLVRELAPLKLPILAVLGNHDYESGHEQEIRQVLVDAGVVVLDGDTCEVKGVGFAGVKGFCGGFGRRTLEPWGEAAVKRFVQESVDEAMKLEKALSRLAGANKVAVLHYAPIEGTVQGEPLEIYPFLGSTRLEEPLDRYGVCLALHGHAHRGSPEGRTRRGVPVYNVALPLLRRVFPDAPPVRIVEVPADRRHAQRAPAADEPAPSRA